MRRDSLQFPRAEKQRHPVRVAGATSYKMAAPAAASAQIGSRDRASLDPAALSEYERAVLSTVNEIAAQTDTTDPEFAKWNDRSVANLLHAIGALRCGVPRDASTLARADSLACGYRDWLGLNATDRITPDTWRDVAEFKPSLTVDTAEASAPVNTSTCAIL